MAITVADILGITPDGRPTYNRWMNAVDAALIAQCSLPSADLADWCYRDAYEAGQSPTDVAREVLEDNDFPFDDEEHD